jgi:hypothetical protein
MIRVDDQQLGQNSRPAAIALALFTLRLMERWKQDVDDYDCAMILIAVVVISAERLLKTGVEPEYRPLDRPIDPALLRKCNVSSIAHATGINRETARRKVNEMIRQGFLVRLDDGTIAFRQGYLQEPRTHKVVARQTAEVAAVAGQLLAIGVLTES